MTRRAWGSGAIYRIKSGPRAGRWVAQLSSGGRTTRRYRTRLCRTRSAARDALRELVDEQAQHLTTTRTSLGDYLARWVAEVRNLRPATRAAYADAIDYHIGPVIGAIPLRDLTPLDVERAIAAWQAAGGSPKSQRNWYAVLRRALAMAVRAGLVGRNVASAAFVDAPRVPAGEPRALAAAEVQRLLAAAAGHPLEALILTALGSGLRQGELLGLTWQDLDGARLHVRQALVRRHGRYLYEEPKTPRSRRTVPLPPRVVAALAAHRAALVAAGFVPIDSGPVFVTRSGQPLNGSAVNKRVQALMARAGIRGGQFRTLRATYASRLFAAGVAARTIADLLGHTREAVTQGHYIASGAGQEAALLAAEAVVT